MNIHHPLKPLAIAGVLLSISVSFAFAAPPDVALKPLETTDSVISDVSASDRTRPFLPGEKLLYFTNIKNGDQVRSPFRVAFVASGMGVAPVAAGEIKNTGHHHILIDMPLPVDIKAPIPFDKPDEYLHQHYKHYGNGETEAVLDLPPGKHKLRLLFANHQHVPYYVTSREIEITVLPKAN
ncbi:DUF4399 domain-containing protein [Variovorax sp. 770b2]|uniref:DUF4399 domain-containing protein n=1 Tax=Variovorax sp. 770b2 TaxID=1566271 RepID=UPI0008EE9894|nr:DUF4399 domain-containing protein [Variovorax sp. 770b2]SFP21386.1 protein of unknown function [Variovorax sp. 770b2]